MKNRRIEANADFRVAGFQQPCANHAVICSSVIVAGDSVPVDSASRRIQYCRSVIVDSDRDAARIQVENPVRASLQVMGGGVSSCIPPKRARCFK